MRTKKILQIALVLGWVALLPFSVAEAQPTPRESPTAQAQPTPSTPEGSEVQERAVPMQKGQGPQPPVSRFQLLPASPAPPEMQAQRQETENALRSINQGRLTKPQLRQVLLNHPDPTIRAKAQQATLSVAGVPYAVTLTPEQRSSSSPDADLGAQGAQLFSSISAIRLDGNSSLSHVGFSVARPFVSIFVNLPSNGWYLIDFYGWGQAAATLRKLNCCGPYPVLESWNLTTTAYENRHFVTVEYLAQGGHSFYFSIDQGFLYFSEVSVQSY